MEVSFALQATGDAPTRAEGEDPTIGNTRALYADRVRVNVYRRPTGPTYADDFEHFTFDQSVELTASRPATAPDDFRYATGSLLLADGYEYRTTAIAYAKSRGEDALFTLGAADNTFAATRFALTDRAQCRTPELFFGTPRYGGDLATPESGDSLFTYVKGRILTGWLYRCVAGIGLTLNEVPADVTDIALLCGTMHTTSGAAFYSDFLDPADPLTATEAERAGRFELMSWTRPAGATGEVTATLTGANLLPVTGRLTVRFTQGGTPRITTLRLHEGTTPDADLARGIVTFRRNHYYQVTGHFDKMATQGLTLSLTVNPHWSGDADLGLGGK